METKQDGEQPTNLIENAQNGSPALKFESVEELEKAYQNLEKEFTKKSQKLNALLKEKSDAELNGSSNDCLPFFEQKDWDQKIQNFLEENPKAKNHAKEISQMLMEDKDLQKANNPLLMAWQKWLTKNYKDKNDYIEDEQFFEELLQNEKIKNKFITNYLNEIKNRDEIPPITSFGFSGTPKKGYKVSSLEEAKELAKKIFNK